jgi:hypothetical protein
MIERGNFLSKLNESEKITVFKRKTAYVMRRTGVSSGIDYTGIAGAIWLLLNENGSTSRLLLAGICGIVAGATSAEIKRIKNQYPLKNC